MCSYHACGWCGACGFLSELEFSHQIIIYYWSLLEFLSHKLPVCRSASLLIHLMIPRIQDLIPVILIPFLASQAVHLYLIIFRVQALIPVILIPMKASLLVHWVSNHIYIIFLNVCLYVCYRFSRQPLNRLFWNLRWAFDMMSERQLSILGPNGCIGNDLSQD